MKLAISGKGGVGKTTISALLAKSLHSAGHKVIVIDADPDSNFAAAMGHPNPDSIKPLIELQDLIEERTGVKPGTTGGMFKLNPKVDDIPEKYAIEILGIKILVAGAVKKGGAGCYCPENAFVRTLVSHLLFEKDTDLIMDMEAGVEHLGRGTISAVDRLLIVVEPGRRSIETAQRIKTLASDIGLKKISAIGNKVRSKSDETFLNQSIRGIEFIGFVPFDEEVVHAEINRKPVVEASSKVNDAIGRIVKVL